MSSPSPPELADYRLVLSLPVQWGDQDALGHVNNTVYIRWFESARVAYLERTGLDHLLTGAGLGPILASITCHYRLPLHYPDNVLVGARVDRIGNTSLRMLHAVYSLERQAVVADGESVVVTYDYAAKASRRVPDNIRQQMEALEGRPLSAPQP